MQVTLKTTAQQELLYPQNSIWATRHHATRKKMPQTFSLLLFPVPAKVTSESTTFKLIWFLLSVSSEWCHEWIKLANTFTVHFLIPPLPFTRNSNFSIILISSQMKLFFRVQLYLSTFRWWDNQVKIRSLYFETMLMKRERDTDETFFGMFSIVQLIICAPWRNTRSMEYN